MTEQSPSQNIDSPNAKLARARFLLEDLKQTIQSYFATAPYEVRSEVRAQRRIYYVSKVETVPDAIATIAGDILHNLRSALDHLAHQLVLVGSKETPTHHVYFPIADDAVKYAVIRDKYLRGSSRDAINAVDTLRPYHGGNALLWQLHDLNIIDKHRLLIVVGSAFKAVDLGAHAQHMFSKTFLAGLPPSDFPKLFIQPANRDFPLEVGTELFNDIATTEAVPNMEFQFELTFGEPGIAEGDAILETLLSMMESVEDAVIQLAPFLKPKKPLRFRWLKTSKRIKTWDQGLQELKRVHIQTGIVMELAVRLVVPTYPLKLGPGFRVARYRANQNRVISKILVLTMFDQLVSNHVNTVEWDGVTGQKIH